MNTLQLSLTTNCGTSNGILRLIASGHEQPFSKEIKQSIGYEAVFSMSEEPLRIIQT